MRNLFIDDIDAERYARFAEITAEHDHLLNRLTAGETLTDDEHGRLKQTRDQSSCLALFLAGAAARSLARTSSTTPPATTYPH